MSITQAMGWHATRKRREALFFGSWKQKQKRADTLARLAKEERRAKEKESRMLADDHLMGPDDDAAVQRKRGECEDFSDIKWSHFQYGRRHITESFIMLDGIADRHAEIKIGATTCPLWRMYRCTGSRDMVAHIDSGWVYMYIVFYQVAMAAGATESRLIQYFRSSKPAGKLRNIAHGNDGFNSKSATMYYVYILAV